MRTFRERESSFANSMETGCCIGIDPGTRTYGVWVGFWLGDLLSMHSVQSYDLSKRLKIGERCFEFHDSIAAIVRNTPMQCLLGIVEEPINLRGNAQPLEAAFMFAVHAMLRGTEQARIPAVILAANPKMRYQAFGIKEADLEDFTGIDGDEHEIDAASFVKLAWAWWTVLKAGATSPFEKSVRVYYNSVAWAMLAGGDCYEV